MDALTNAPPLAERLALQYEDLNTDILRALDGVAATPIASDEDAIAARDLVKPLKELQRRIEAHRAEEKDYFFTSGKTVDEFFKKMRGGLDKIVAGIQAAADAYQTKKREEARRIEAAKQRIAAAVGDAAPAYVAPKETVRVATTTGVALSGRVDWKFEVTDATLLPRDLLMPNEAAIKARVAGLKATLSNIDDAKIPGVRIFEKVGSTFR
jgi:hypothetical protein